LFYCGVFGADENPKKPDELWDKVTLPVLITALLLALKLAIGVKPAVILGVLI
jgi:hypothetical protein